MNLAVLENHDTEQLALQLQEVLDSKSEDQLYEIIGKGLYDSGLEVSTSNFTEATFPIFNTISNKAFMSSVDFVEDEKAIDSSEAKNNGKKLMTRIKEEICSNESIRNLFTGKGNLKDYLKTLIPAILALISSTLTLGVIGLAIAVSVIALVIKIGYENYCSI